jgi:hypothetical protein
MDLLSPRGRGGGPLRSNGKVRGLLPLFAHGDKPLTLSRFAGPFPLPQGGRESRAAMIKQCLGIACARACVN